MSSKNISQNVNHVKNLPSPSSTKPLQSPSRGVSDQTLSSQHRKNITSSAIQQGAHKLHQLKSGTGIVVATTIPGLSSYHQQQQQQLQRQQQYKLQQQKQQQSSPPKPSMTMRPTSSGANVGNKNSVSSHGGSGTKLTSPLTIRTSPVSVTTSFVNKRPTVSPSQTSRPLNQLPSATSLLSRGSPSPSSPYPLSSPRNSSTDEMPGSKKTPPAGNNSSGSGSNKSTMLYDRIHPHMRSPHDLSRNSTPSPQKSPGSSPGNSAASLFDRIQSQIRSQEATEEQGLNTLRAAMALNFRSSSSSNPK